MADNDFPKSNATSAKLFNKRLIQTRDNAENIYSVLGTWDTSPWDPNSQRYSCSAYIWNIYYHILYKLFVLAHKILLSALISQFFHSPSQQAEASYDKTFNQS